jgi:hypothetical protein
MTLNMVQDLRTAFDRFTNEIRMAGSGLPGYHGVVSGSETALIVRGDFNNTSTTVTSTGSYTGGVFTVGSTEGLAVGQTVSLLQTYGVNAGAAALAKVTAVNATTGNITLNSSDLLPITSGAQMSNFGPGAIISVVERRTYAIETDANDKDRGAITRKVTYENTQSTGATVQSEEIIAQNVLTTDGDIGLRFVYLDAADNVLDFNPTTGLVDSTKVAKVKIELQARTAERDLQTHEYRTLRLTALIQVRGQYIPAVGF